MTRLCPPAKSLSWSWTNATNQDIKALAPRTKKPPCPVRLQKPSCQCRMRYQRIPWPLSPHSGRSKQLRPPGHRWRGTARKASPLHPQLLRLQPLRSRLHETQVTRTAWQKTQWPLQLHSGRSTKLWPLPHSWKETNPEAVDLVNPKPPHVQHLACRG